MNPAANPKPGYFMAWASLISNIALTLIKLLTGLFFGSEVLLADGLHNAGDVIASITAIGSMRISNQPADEDHPYGHGKAEVLAAGVVAIILGLAALYIAFHAVATLTKPPSHTSLLAWGAALLSILWKYVLYVYTLRAAKLRNSKSLLATAKDHLADVYASSAAFIGIGFGLLGDYAHIRWMAYGDPAAGLLVAILVLRMALEMGKETIDVLMEKNVDPQQIDHYLQLVHQIPQVKRIDRIRARELGHYILVDIRVSVPGELTIQEGHDISREIKSSIQQTYPNVEEVLVHLNPWYPESEA